jgi:RimJ/RimL family protein N-acetyltransferase
MHIKIGDFMIRNWRMADAPAIARYANNKKIWINLRDAFPHPYSLKDAERFLNNVFESDPITVFSIATGNEAIGCIGLTLGTDVHRFTAEMGYWLAEPFWGRGIMTRAVKAMTAYAISDMKLHRIFAEPYTTNPASVKVLEKAGFIQEGILHANVLKNGKVLDQYLYAFVNNRVD